MPQGQIWEKLKVAVHQQLYLQARLGHACSQKAQSIPSTTSPPFQAQQAPVTVFPKMCRLLKSRVMYIYDGDFALIRLETCID